jgi:hypothetical protein
VKTWWGFPAVAALAIAGLAFGTTEPQVSSKAIAAVEAMVNDKFRVPGPDPYDLLGTARTTWLEGYGALTTVEIELVYVSGITPFRPAYSPQEVASLHDRKVKKLPVLKDTMRTLIAGTATALDSVPPNQHIAFEARLWHFSWEDAKGIPQRIFMSGEKSKILAAQGSPAALAAAIEEQAQ